MPTPPSLPSRAAATATTAEPCQATMQLDVAPLWLWKKSLNLHLSHPTRLSTHQSKKRNLNEDGYYSKRLHEDAAQQPQGDRGRQVLHAHCPATGAAVGQQPPLCEPARGHAQGSGAGCDGLLPGRDSRCRAVALVCDDARAALRHSPALLQACRRLCRLRAQCRRPALCDMVHHRGATL